MAQRVIKATIEYEDCWRPFKRLVDDVHGTTHGMLSAELENAVRAYMPTLAAKLESDLNGR